MIRTNEESIRLLALDVQLLIEKMHNGDATAGAEYDRLHEHHSRHFMDKVCVEVGKIRQERAQERSVKKEKETTNDKKLDVFFDEMDRLGL